VTAIWQSAVMGLYFQTVRIFIFSAALQLNRRGPCVIHGQITAGAAEPAEHGSPRTACIIMQKYGHVIVIVAACAKLLMIE
jgi:hypothetical protein